MLTFSFKAAIARLSGYASLGPVDANAYAWAAEAHPTWSTGYSLDASNPRSMPHVRGQELEVWNAKEATTCLAHLSRGIAAVDSTQLLLSYKVATESPGLSRLSNGLVTARDTIRVRLGPGWRPITWRVASEPHKATSPTDASSGALATARRSHRNGD
jgi:hypothetical protein